LRLVPLGVGENETSRKPRVLDEHFMLQRTLSAGMMLLGVALLGWAAWDYLSNADGPGVMVERPIQEISVAAGQQPPIVRFAVSNPTRHSVEVVGLVDC